MKNVILWMKRSAQVNRSIIHTEYIYSGFTTGCVGNIARSEIFWILNLILANIMINEPKLVYGKQIEHLYSIYLYWKLQRKLWTGVNWLIFPQPIDNLNTPICGWSICLLQLPARAEIFTPMLVLEHLSTLSSSIVRGSPSWSSSPSVLSCPR